MTELPREPHAPVWPLGSSTLDSAPDHPALQAIDQALGPLRPLLRHLKFDADPGSPGVTLSFGEEYHLASVRLLDDDTVLIDLPVGEVTQTANNLQCLLATNLGRSWPLRVDSVTDTCPPQAVVVIEHRLPRDDLAQLAAVLVDGWIEKSLTQGLLHALNGKGDSL